MCASYTLGALWLTVKLHFLSHRSYLHTYFTFQVQETIKWHGSYNTLYGSTTRKYSTPSICMFTLSKSNMHNNHHSVALLRSHQ